MDGQILMLSMASSQSTSVTTVLRFFFATMLSIVCFDVKLHQRVTEVNLSA